MPTASRGRSFGKKAKGKGREGATQEKREGVELVDMYPSPSHHHRHPPPIVSNASGKPSSSSQSQGSRDLQRKLPFRLHRRCPSRSTETPAHPQDLSVSPSLPSLLLAHEPLPFLAPKQLALWGPALLVGTRGVSW